MLIHHDKKIIFLFNPKCETTILTQKLKKIGFIDIAPFFYTQFKNNIHYSTMKQIVNFLEATGRDSHHYTYITFVRNPFDRIISHYNFCKFDKDWHSFYSNDKRNALKNFNLSYEFQYNGHYKNSLNDYVMYGYINTKNLYTHPQPLNEFMILDKGYNICVFKVEDMCESLKTLKRMLCDLDISNSEISNSEIIDSKAYFFPKSIHIIKNIFKYDFENYYNDDL